MYKIRCKITSYLPWSDRNRISGSVTVIMAVNKMGLTL